MALRLAFFFWIAATALGQQSKGELRLTVRDATGAALPARAELANQSTATQESVDLPPDGRYFFKNLPFGFYKLSVSHAGFVTASELIEIRSASPLVREITLGVAPIESAVQVSEAATLMDPNRTGTAYYAGRKTIGERRSGTPGRDMIDLIAMQPGWLLEANGVLHPRESEYGTQYIINGFPVQDNRSPSFAPNIETSDVQSIKAYTSGIPAEFGRKVGGVIEVTTDRNTSPGLHGVASVQGGSFATTAGYLSTQYVAGRTTATVAGESFTTDRYLDPPVLENYTNHGSNASFTGTLERDLDDTNRVRVAASHRGTWFLVPNERIQEAAGQRQDRTSFETQGQMSYQHIFSPSVLGAIRGMFRDVGARLWSNPLATPISAGQDRGFREAYVNASLSGHKGRHEWKAGGDASFASLREQFGYDIVAYRLNGVRVFDRDTPATLRFDGRAQDREQSAYIQDLVRLGRLTLSAGLRFDHYRLLVDERAVSPRLGAAWNAQRLGLALHASYDRVFGTPAFENLLVSAWPGVLSLNDAGLYLKLRPARGNYYDAGLTKSLGAKLRLDAGVFRRDIRNFGDDDLLLNTGVAFPIAFDRGTVHGLEVKLEAPKWGPFAGFASWTNMHGTGQFPITGGFFPDEDARALLESHERFPITQDQRNTVRAMGRVQIVQRLWMASTAAYNSGLPVEALEQSLEFLTTQYGAAVVSQVDRERGRVRPSFSLDASAGAELWRKERRSVSAQADMLNMTGRLNVINFAGLFSGTALAPPRGFGIRLRVEF